MALSLLEYNKSGIRDNVFNEISLQVLDSDTRLNSLIEYMENLFKKEETNEVYEL